MKISKPRILENQKTVSYTVDVEYKNNISQLWYRLPKEYSHFVSNSSDAPLVALLIPAMAAGEDIYLDGTVSNKLLFNLSTSYQALLQHIIPWLARINIHPQGSYSQESTSGYVATGFSAGVDSFCTVADHIYGGVQDGYKLSHFLFHNVGSHGNGAKGEQLFWDRFNKLYSVTSEMGIPFIWINSNLDSFYSDQLYFQQTHTPRNVSVSLLLQKGISKYLYSSTFTYPQLFVGRTYDTAYTDPIGLPLLSNENLEAISVGSHYSRFEKTNRVSKVSISYYSLDVCVEGNMVGNCSKCWKCLRTLLTLEILGSLELYSKCFDLNVYEKHRTDFIVKVLRSKDPLLREIIHFAHTRNFIIPLNYKIRAKFEIFMEQFKIIINLPFRIGRKIIRILKQVLIS